MGHFSYLRLIEVVYMIPLSQDEIRGGGGGGGGIVNWKIDDCKLKVVQAIDLLEPREFSTNNSVLLIVAWAFVYAWWRISINTPIVFRFGIICLMCKTGLRFLHVSKFKSVCPPAIIQNNEMCCSCYTPQQYRLHGRKSWTWFIHFHSSRYITSTILVITLETNPTQIGKLMHIHRTNFVTPSPPVQCCKP